jgi:TPP-dependent pyruvate/acetoin dehydrogenase alpha subunit
MAKSSTKNTGKKTASFSLISDQTLKEMYTAMLGCRLLEEKTRRRRSSKKVLTATPVTMPVSGQEAVIVGTTIALRPDDTITAPGGEVIVRMQGYRPAKKLSRKAEAERAAAESLRNVIAFAASSAAQLTIGAGIALAQKDSGSGRVVVAFGDANAESMAAWSEALLLAGNFRLPILFVLRPGASEMEIAAIGERARLAGVMTIPVDFTDAVAMYRVSYESIARARKCAGATLIVSTAYTLGESAAEKSEDPLKRMEAYLANKGLFSAKWKADLLKKLK